MASSYVISMRGHYAPSITGYAHNNIQRKTRAGLKVLHFYTLFP